MIDFAEIMAVAQDIGERAVGQVDATDSLARGQGPQPGPDVPTLELALERRQGAQFKVEAEDEPDGLRLFLIDDELPSRRR